MEKGLANTWSWIITGVLVGGLMIWQPLADTESTADAEPIEEAVGGIDSRCRDEIASRIEGKNTIQFQPPEDLGPVGPFHEAYKYEVRYRYGGAGGVMVVDKFICGLNRDSDTIGLIPVKS